jgi:hypothetical protein
VLEGVKLAYQGCIIPFAQDPGGNYFCFRYNSKQDKNPVVVFYDHEEFGSKMLTKLSNTFDDFIGMIK